MGWFRSLSHGIGRAFTGTRHADIHAPLAPQPIINEGPPASTAVASDEPRGEHCPFLNRADERCAEYFSLDRMEHALEFCFDKYEACPLYAQLLAERQERRESARTLVGSSGAAAAAARSASAHDRDARPLVQVQVAARYAKQPV
jgi:hypothetical protein